MRKIGIIGYGYVGRAIAYGFSELMYKIQFHDPKYSESRPLEEVVQNAEIIFLCVPTPSTNDGLDLSVVDSCIQQISKISASQAIVLKSTVLPGTTSMYRDRYPRLRLCFNPEFLTEKDYQHDFVHADRIVVGGPSEIVRDVSDFYRERFPAASVINCSDAAAEFGKYGSNAMLALSVIFANELYGICSGLGIDYNAVERMLRENPLLRDAHLSVTASRGFGGKCLPKDIVALIRWYHHHGWDASVFESVWEENLRIRLERDWEKIEGAMPVTDAIPLLGSAHQHDFPVVSSVQDPDVPLLVAYAESALSGCKKAAVEEMLAVCHHLSVSSDEVLHVICSDHRIALEPIQKDDPAMRSSIEQLVGLARRLNTPSLLLQTVAKICF